MGIGGVRKSFGDPAGEGFWDDDTDQLGPSSSLLIQPGEAGLGVTLVKRIESHGFCYKYPVRNQSKPPSCG